MLGVQGGVVYTYCPRDVCSSRVTSVLAPGQVQLLASNAYLNSSSQTTCSANFTCSLCSGLATANFRRIWSTMNTIKGVLVCVCVFAKEIEFELTEA